MEWSTYMFVKTALKGLQWASKEVVEQGVPTLLDDDDDDDEGEPEYWEPLAGLLFIILAMAFSKQFFILMDIYVPCHSKRICGVTGSHSSKCIVFVSRSKN